MDADDIHEAATTGHAGRASSTTGQSVRGGAGGKLGGRGGGELGHRRRRSEAGRSVHAVEPPVDRRRGRVIRMLGDAQYFSFLKKT